MRQVIMISKHIHSSFASYSSNDFATSLHGTIFSKNFPFLNNEVIEELSGDKLFLTIYLSADKVFYNRALHSGKGIFHNGYHNTEEYKNHIDSYIKRGWVIEDEPTKAQKAYWKREERRNEKKSKEAGLVLWMSYDNLKKAPKNVYQGGFSDEVFYTPQLQEYIKHGGVFGWIGDSGTRRAEHDKVIEEGLRERGLSPQAMYNWISSGDGRHFADGLSWFHTLDEQIEEIKKNINRIFNLCLIYGSSRHEGTLKSTNEIRRDYEEQGLLLPEGEQNYDPQAYMKLMALAFAAGNNNLPKEVINALPALMEEVKNPHKPKK